MPTYAALLLFQFRMESDRRMRRICEERIINFEAEEPDAALDFAIRKGIEEQHELLFGARRAWFEFIGVVELVELTVDDEGDCREVWTRFVEKVLPMERRTALIPPKEKLALFKSSRYKMKL